MTRTLPSARVGEDDAADHAGTAHVADLCAAASCCRGVGRDPRAWRWRGALVGHGSGCDEDTEAAAANGLAAERDLLQMFVPLPVDEPVPPIALRSFVPGKDEDAWVEVNNRAFAAHPEQGGWTRDVIEQRESGAVVRSERVPAPPRSGDGTAGRIRVDEGARRRRHHRSARSIVIAVDPDFGGRKLGRALTLAGPRLDAPQRVASIAGCCTSTPPTSPRCGSTRASASPSTTPTARTQAASTVRRVRRRRRPSSRRGTSRAPAIVAISTWRAAENTTDRPVNRASSAPTTAQAASPRTTDATTAAVPDPKNHGNSGMSAPMRERQERRHGRA